ncbi:hypothetical protein ACQPZA_16640 [Pseudonocardia xinjiangensis]|uniref:hypothetical protein n=1 Tax=Pseudonocardia xinjiangensis TaxID=75289 RepID=UPI003D8B3081
MMATYQYRCPECGPWVAALPMSSAGAARTTGRWPRRRRHPLSSTFTGQGLVRHRLREEAGRDVPEVVVVNAQATRRRPGTALRPTALPLP